MKYPTSETTKQELSAALKTLMSQKPLEKISIREITDLCGLRRETFYYHFADIYDLVKWMFEEEAIVLLRQHEGVQLWQEGLLQLFHYIQFYVIALVGTVESWLLGELDRTPEELIAFADVMLKDHIRGAALRIQGKSALL